MVPPKAFLPKINLEAKFTKTQEKMSLYADLLALYIPVIYMKTIERKPETIIFEYA